MRIFLYSILVLGMFSCIQETDYPEHTGGEHQVRTLQADELEWIRALKLDTAFSSFIASHTDSSLTALKRNDQLKGIAFMIEDAVGDSLRRHSKQLREQNISLVYLSYPINEHLVDMGILKPDSLFDELYIIGTVGYNEASQTTYSTPALSALLKKWNQKHKLRLTGVDKGWIRLRMTEERKDLDSITAQIGRMCPEQLAYHGDVRQMKKFFEKRKFIEMEWH